MSLGPWQASPPPCVPELPPEEVDGGAGMVDGPEEPLDVVPLEEEVEPDDVVPEDEVVCGGIVEGPEEPLEVVPLEEEVEPLEDDVLPLEEEVEPLEEEDDDELWSHEPP